MRRVLALFAALVLLSNGAPAIASGMTASSRVPLDARELHDANLCLADEPLSLETALGSSLFLQRDPSNYSDSVNLYAGFRHDPVNMRDPTGRFVPFILAAAALSGG